MGNGWAIKNILIKLIGKLLYDILNWWWDLTWIRLIIFIRKDLIIKLNYFWN